MVNIRNKGSKAELEFCQRFQPFSNNRRERNLLQTREGGSDIMGSHPFVIEIKRVEDTGVGNKNKWWAQVERAVQNPEIEIPVVAYRPSRSPWSFLVPWEFRTIDTKGYCEISEDQWLVMVLHILKSSG